MAQGQVGGNQSVHWLTTADDASAIKNELNGGKWRQSGVDYHQNAALGTHFTVRIKLPARNPDRAAVLSALLSEISSAVNSSQERVEFELPIEKGAAARTQIQVVWGLDPGWNEGLEEVHPEPADKTRKVTTV